MAKECDHTIKNMEKILTKNMIRNKEMEIEEDKKHLSLTVFTEP